MALKQPFSLKTVIGTGVVELKADAGEAFLIKDILTRSAGSNYITCRIEKSTVGYFRMKGPYGSHQEFRRGHAQHSHTIRLSDGDGGLSFNNRLIRDGAGTDRSVALLLDNTITGVIHDEVQALMWSGFHRNPTLLDYLGQLGIFKGFPVAEGQTFSITGMGGANSITMIVYEIYDPEDISAEQENGSRSTEYLFLNYGTTGDPITSPGDDLYDTPVSPAEFPDFPFGKVVPSKYEIDLHGICGSPRCPGTNNGTNYIYTKWIKMVKEREVLFDEDRNGILFMHPSTNVESNIDQTAEGFSLIGNLSAYDNNPPLMFPTPLLYLPGDELNVYLTTEGDGSYGTIAADCQELCLIEKVRRVE
ncbi:hypothetical protein ES703_106510 [subsurface metagenome]